MGYNIIVVPQAQQELDEIIGWYEQQASNLGIEFLLEFYSQTHLLSESPKAFPKVFKEYRKMVMAKFPYLIFYLLEEQEQTIVIVAIWNSFKNPKDLSSRLK